MSLTISAIITEWDAVYRAGGQNMNDLLVKLLNKSETESIFTRVITDKTILEKATVEVSRVLQRFQKAFTPVSGLTFEPTKIPLYKIKIDAAEYPDELEESWLGFLGDQQLDRTQWPFIKWWLSLLLDRAEHDMETVEIYGGAIDTITPGTATAAGETINGIKFIINDHVDNGFITPYAVGAPPTDPLDFVTYMEDWFESIPELQRNLLDFFFMSKTLESRYRTGMIQKYNMNYQMINDISTIKMSNVKVKGLVSHAGEDKIWSTPKANRVLGVKKPGNERIFEVEKEDRKVKAYTDMYKGLGFWIPEYVITNDQELNP